MASEARTAIIILHYLRRRKRGRDCKSGIQWTIVIETLENRLNSYVELCEFVGKELRESLSCGLTRAELEAGFTQFLTQKSTPLSR